MGTLKETHSRSVCSNSNNVESEVLTVIVTFEVCVCVCVRARTHIYTGSLQRLHFQHLASMM